MSDAGFGYTSDAVACVDYCLSMGAAVISNSWSGAEDNPAMLEALKRARDKGKLFLDQTSLQR